MSTIMGTKETVISTSDYPVNLPQKATRNDLLKIIAMITMFIDHTGVLLFPDVDILRTIGRIAFPIFAYGIAVGYRHTSNKLKYLLRLLVFGLIAELPYMYLNYDFTMEMYHYNVMLFFAYSFLMLFAYDCIVKTYKQKAYHLTMLWTILMIAVIVIPEIIAYNFENFAFSYNGYGLVMILIFYIAHNRTFTIIVGYVILTFVSTYQLGATVLAQNSLEWLGEKISFFESLTRFDMVWQNITTYNNGLMTLGGYFYQARSIMGLGIILLFRKFEYKLPINRYVGYIFYPTQLTSF
jgi:hypothetical protein